MFQFKDTWPFHPRRIPFFYGYVIVVCSVLGMLFSAPGQTIGVSLFTDHLIRALSLSRVQLSIAYALGTITSSLIIGRVGALMDRSGTRTMAALASFSLGAALLYMSQVDRVSRTLQRLIGISGPSVPVAMICVFVGFLLMRFIGQGVLTLASRTMVMKWFDRFRGRVNSALGISVSLLFSGSPFVFNMLIERYTWRGAWIVMALALGALFPVVILAFFRDDPERCGMIPDGRLSKAKGYVPDSAMASFTPSQARRTVAFWVFNLSTALFSLLVTAISFHVVSIFEAAGRTRGEAIAIFLPSSVVAVVINLAVGTLSDTDYFKHRLKFFVGISLLGLLSSCFGVVFLRESWGMYLMIAGNGIGSGVFGTMSTVSWPRYFGTKHLGALVGTSMSYMVFASAIGPFIFSLSLKLSGSYNTGALVCGAAAIGVLGMSFWANKPELPPETA